MTVVMRTGSREPGGRGDEPLPVPDPGPGHHRHHRHLLQVLGQPQLPQDVRLPSEGVWADDVHLPGEDVHHDNDDDCLHLHLPGLPDDPQLLRHHHRLRHGPNLRI